MPSLEVIDTADVGTFADDLRRAWAAGHAALPLDHRLPGAVRDQLLAAARSAPAGLEPGDGLVVATSGSTGTPKLVVHSHQGLAAHAAAVHQRLGLDRDRDRWLACLPLAHLGGLGVVVRSLVDDVPLTVAAGPDPDSLAAALAAGATLTSLVPTALDRVDPAPWRWVLLGGSADSRTRPDNVVRTYGSTETGGGVIYDGLPLRGIEVDVDAAGRIRLRGPSLARGRLDADTGSVVPLADADGWLLTGDLGSWDGQRLTVHGRADEMIVSGGENIWPGPIEDRLRLHPAVADVAVVGRPDPDWGQLVVAVVVAAGPVPPTLESLRDHVREALPAYAAPRALEVVEMLPRTSLGKVRRAELKPPPPAEGGR